MMKVQLELLFVLEASHCRIARTLLHSLAPCTALLEETVLKQQGPSTQSRADTIEANTGRYFENANAISKKKKKKKKKTAEVNDSVIPEEEAKNNKSKK